MRPRSVESTAIGRAPYRHTCDGICLRPPSTQGVTGRRCTARMLGFGAVGFVVLGAPLNAWMYRVRRRVLRRAIVAPAYRSRERRSSTSAPGRASTFGEWERLGAGAVTGVDLSAAAIERLRAEIPTAKFLEADIADAIPEGSRASTTSSRHSTSSFTSSKTPDSRAIENLARLTRPRGHLLLSENFLRSSTLRHRHQVSRTRSEIDEALSAAGLRDCPAAYRCSSC